MCTMPHLRIVGLLSFERVRSALLCNNAIGPVGVDRILRKLSRMVSPMSKVRPRNVKFGKILSELLILTLLFATSAANSTSLRYFGNGVNDIDRVKIRVDDPQNSNPGPPADIGVTDFTIEFWLKATADNTAGAISCGANGNWISGNIVLDRDRFNQGSSYGVSLGAGRLAFSTENAASDVRTICGTTDLRDGSWHHVAFQRRRSDGFLWLYVDGTLEASSDGPNGDISYPDNGVPGDFCSGSCDFSDPFIVIGAEKHDAGASYPSFFGWVDEVRLSDVLRYSGNFTPPQQAFVADADTAALYHFDEGNGNFIGDSATGSLSPGERRFGGTPAGPVWDADTPFSGGGSPGTIQFSASGYTTGEGSGSQVITVTRTGGSTGIVTVDYATADGTAVSGSDYQSASGTFTWIDGDTASRTFSVTVVDDVDVEGDENINLSLSNITGGATLGARNTASLTITDNDIAAPGQLQLSLSNYAATEGSGDAVITAIRTGETSGAVGVDYSVSDGTATAGVDYQTVSGTLNWADGDGSSKTFVIPILDDAAVENDETVNVSLSNVTGGASLGAPVSATLTISDDDVPNPGLIRLSAAAYSAGEDGGTATIIVSRIVGSDGTVAVDYATSNGTASSGADYQSATGTLNWADGELSNQSFTITLVDDAIMEGDETVNISLSNVAGAALGDPQDAVLTIVDDEVASPGVVQFSASSYDVGEGGSSISISVTRSGGASGAVTVDYSSSNGTATAGSDYQAASGTLNWPDGDASAKTFLVSILNDSAEENDETVALNLSVPTGGVAIGTPASATLTIVDDDTTRQPSSGGGSTGYFFVTGIMLLVARRLKRHRIQVRFLPG